jgi:hypothetical protein
MLTVTIPLLVAAATALAPRRRATGASSRLAQLGRGLSRSYKPAPLSLRIDEKLTAHCIENILRRQRSLPPKERAAIDALIAATPYLIGLLNIPASATSGGGAAGSDPAAPPTQP